MRKKLTVVLVLAALICALLAVRGYRKEQHAGESYEALADAVAAESVPESVAPERESGDTLAVASPVSEAVSVTSEAAVVNPIDFTALKQTAPEAYAWIRIPDTKIDYPVVQSASDDSYYLNHNAEQQSEFAGAIFSERYNRTDLTDPMTVLYGHNMKNGSMFQNLHRFEDREFFDTHRELYLYTEDRVLTYRIFAAYTFDNSHLLETFDFRNQSVFHKYVSDILALKTMYANIDSEITIPDDAKLLTLSTCTGDSSSRYLVQAVLVE